jgi:hypothetical protein
MSSTDAEICTHRREGEGTCPRCEAMSHERLLELAKRNPAPDRWYDEDFSGLRDPFVSLREQQAKLREHEQ